MMAGNPNWWSVNGMHPRSPPPPPPPSSPWSQLLLGGLTGAGGEDVRFGTSLFQQQKKIENWEEQILNPSFRVPIVDVKQEVSQTCQLYGHGHHHIDDDHQYQAGSRSPCWPQLTNIPDSSPTSCITSVSNNNILNFSNSNLDREIKNQHQDHSLECNSTSIGGVSKKPKIQPSSTQPALKVRKEKLGDRITALHQLVSPFGKTDTASVLSEAIGYIRFLQGQIEALSSPYMSNASRNMGHQQSVQERDCSYPEESGQNNEDEAKDLRSRGLCLVPVSCTQHVGNDINGADYWAPALGGGF